MKHDIERAIHLLRQALEAVDDDVTSAKRSVQDAVNALSSILAASAQGPDDQRGTGSSQPR